MATIPKREGKKDPCYRVMVRIKGFPIQVKTFKRLTEAKQWVQGVNVPAVRRRRIS